LQPRPTHHLRLRSFPRIPPSREMYGAVVGGAVPQPVGRTGLTDSPFRGSLGLRTRPCRVAKIVVHQDLQRLCKGTESDDVPTGRLLSSARMKSPGPSQPLLFNVGDTVVPAHARTHQLVGGVRAVLEKAAPKPRRSYPYCPAQASHRSATFRI